MIILGEVLIGIVDSMGLMFMSVKIVGKPFYCGHKD